MTPESTTKLATALLDRFFRDAGGRTNHQLDVNVTLEDLGLAREQAKPAIDYLKNRDLLNLFGTEIAYLTDLGVRASAEDLDITKLPVAPDPLASRPSSSRAGTSTGDRSDAPDAPDPSTPDGRPLEAQVTHIDISTGHQLTLAIGWRVRIGRGPGNEICIKDKRASKHHAEVRYRDGRYALIDLDSSNGTLVNGSYVVEPTTLAHGDEIVIGRTMLLFQAPLGVREPVRPRPSSGSDDPARAAPPEDLPAPSATVPEDVLEPERKNGLTAARATLHQEGPGVPRGVATRAPGPTPPQTPESFDGRPARAKTGDEAQSMAWPRRTPGATAESEDAPGAPSSGSLENPATVALDHPTLTAEVPECRADAPLHPHTPPPHPSPAAEPDTDRGTNLRAPSPTADRAAIPRARSSSIRRSEPTWNETLALLRRHVEQADLPDRARLLEAIDVISDHPYVRVALNLVDG